MRASPWIASNPRSRICEKGIALIVLISSWRVGSPVLRGISSSNPYSAIPPSASSNVPSPSFRRSTNGSFDCVTLSNAADGVWVVLMYRYNGTLPARGNQGHFLRIISGASPLSDGYSANEAKESLLCDETCRFRSLEAVCPFFRKHLFHPTPPFPIPVPQTQND